MYLCVYQNTVEGITKVLQKEKHLNYVEEYTVI